MNQNSNLAYISKKDEAFPSRCGYSMKNTASPIEPLDTSEEKTPLDILPNNPYSQTYSVRENKVDASFANHIRHPKRFEIWIARLGTHYNTSIQSGNRPVIIISNKSVNQYSRTFTALPLTSSLKKPDFPTHVKVTVPYRTRNSTVSLENSIILAEQIITVDISMLKKPICRIQSVKQQQDIMKAVAIQLGMYSSYAPKDNFEHGK